NIRHHPESQKWRLRLRRERIAEGASQNLRQFIGPTAAPRHLLGSPFICVPRHVIEEKRIREELTHRRSPHIRIPVPVQLFPLEPRAAGLIREITGAFGRRPLVTPREAASVTALSRVFPFV